MSRAKSFLPHTQEELWRRDVQYDLTVSESAGAGRVSRGSAVLPVPAAVLLQHPVGLRERAAVGQGG